MRAGLALRRHGHSAVDRMDLEEYTALKCWWGRYTGYCSSTYLLTLIQSASGWLMYGTWLALSHQLMTRHGSMRMVQLTVGLCRGATLP